MVGGLESGGGYKTDSTSTLKDVQKRGETEGRAEQGNEEARKEGMEEQGKEEKD